MLDFPKSKRDDFIDAPAGAIDELKKVKVRGGNMGVEKPMRDRNQGPVKIN